MRFGNVLEEIRPGVFAQWSDPIEQLAGTSDYLSF
jgi:hypothetical protein